MCRYDEYLPCRIPTLNDFFCHRVQSRGIRSYFPVGFDSDNALLRCFGMELVISETNLARALVGEISEFDTDALGIRVRLTRY